MNSPLALQLIRFGFLVLLWLFVLAAATPATAGTPILIDESLEQIVPESIQPGDIVGISVHTGNALRGYQVGRMARARGIRTIVDGAHAGAQFPFKLRELECDSYGVSLHKWLLAPNGTGLLFVKRDTISRVRNVCSQDI